MKVPVDVETSLEIIDSFHVNNPKKILYSYTHTNTISRSRIDKIFISLSIAPRIE